MTEPRLPTTLSEYRRRFKGLPMREYRRRMSPALFAAFMRFAGCIETRYPVDIVAVCALEPVP